MVAGWILLLPMTAHDLVARDIVASAHTFVIRPGASFFIELLFLFASNQRVISLSVTTSVYF